MPPAAPPAEFRSSNAALERLARQDPWQVQQAAERRRYERMEREGRKSSWSGRAGAGPEYPQPTNNAALQRLASKAAYPPDQQVRTRTRREPEPEPELSGRLP